MYLCILNYYLFLVYIVILWLVLTNVCMFICIQEFDFLCIFILLLLLLLLLLYADLVSFCCSRVYSFSIIAKCSIALLGLFSPNVIDQSSCKMGLVLACMVIILHDDWSIRSGINGPDMACSHLAAMLIVLAR